MRALADGLAAHPDFQNAVTLADIDGVPIAAVLDEAREFYAAARLARLLVTNARTLEREGAGAPPDGVDPDAGD